MENSFEYIVIGSGMSGVGAALALHKKSKKFALLDVGIAPGPTSLPDKSLYNLSANDRFKLMVGDGGEGLSGFQKNRNSFPPRLNSPQFRFVTEKTQELSPAVRTNFEFIQSLAKGGLANAWGAGAYRFQDPEFRGFPFQSGAMSSYYDEASNEMGISGLEDDMVESFGRDANLQKPSPLTRNGLLVERNYLKQKAWFQKTGVTLGRPRLAILSKDHNGRRGHRPHNLEYWCANLPEVYTPRYTLDRLIEKGALTYHSGLKVEKLRRDQEWIVVSATDLQTQKNIEFRAKNIFLGAGTVNSSRIILNSFDDLTSELPLLETPMFQIPGVLLKNLGKGFEREGFGSFLFNLNYKLENAKDEAQGGLMELSSVARAELFGTIPAPASLQIESLRQLTTAVLVNILFVSSDFQSPSKLSLMNTKKLRIVGGENSNAQEAISLAVTSMRKLGLFSSRFLVRESPVGASIHYGGTMPMRQHPKQKYDLSANGELASMPGVFIIDGSGFPRLPAKNLSLTLMANAMRIADLATRSLL